MKKGVFRAPCDRSLFYSGESASVACHDPLKFEPLDTLSNLFNMPVVAYLSLSKEILAAIDKLFTRLEERDVIRLWDVSSDEASANDGQAVDDILRNSTQLPPVIRMVNLILLEAIRETASDIHFESTPHGFRIRYRIDGILYDIHSPPKQLSSSIIARIKVMAGLNVAERRKPQDGRIRIRTRDREIDIRVATIPAIDGERLVLRLLDRSHTMIPLESIGLNQAHTRQIEQLLTKTSGMILVSGPTGSGKDNHAVCNTQQVELTRKEYYHHRRPDRIQTRRYQSASSECQHWFYVRQWSEVDSETRP